jgi:hypothetical protein
MTGMGHRGPFRHPGDIGRSRPKAGPQPGRHEPLLMPHTCRSQCPSGSADYRTEGRGAAVRGRAIAGISTRLVVRIAGKHFTCGARSTMRARFSNSSVQRRRDKCKAVKLMRKLLRQQGFVPKCSVAIPAHGGRKARDAGKQRRKRSLSVVTVSAAPGPRGSR